MSDEVAEIGERGAISQSIFRKNLPVTQFFCGDSSNWLGLKVSSIPIFILNQNDRPL